MQSSMGQAATTLNSLLDMYGEQAQGDSEELIEAQLLQARKDLIEAVRVSGDCTTPVNRLVQLKCPVSMKYAQLNVRQLLKDNNESVAHLKAIPVALNMLEKYGRHLLKPPGSRVDQWRQIKFNNPIFKDRVLPMQGALEVVQQMGYSDAADCGLQFALEEPDPAATSNLVADIILARTEMERYLMNKHPHPETVHALLPESTIDQVVAHWENVMGAEAGTVSINPPTPSLVLQQVLHPPTPVSAAVEAETEAATPVQMSELPVAAESGQTAGLSPSASRQQEDSLHKACDICGEIAATLWCRLCDNKQLCKACDDMWHKHPKRLNHERESISSLPSPSSAPAADAIMGPFGIRAVHSLSAHGRDVERSPTPVSSGASAAGNRESSRTPPPQQRQPTPPPATSQAAQLPQQLGAFPQQQQSGQPQQLQQQQAPLNTQASLAQHHQQLQFYLQQQQQQQQLLQQQQQGLSTANDYQNRQPLYPYSTMGMTPSHFPQDNLPATYIQSTLDETPVSTVPSQNVAYPPFPVLDHDPASHARHGEDAAVKNAPVSAQQQRLTNVSQPDYNLRTPQSSVLPGTVGGTAPPTYSDMSLRKPTGAESVKAFSGASVTESSVFASAPERRNSGHAPRRAPSISAGGASMSESALLKSVLAETDYEKRAAKCDIRLLTLEEDLQDVESKLNDMMLNSVDFTESGEFLMLNRHKARLMKEHQALSNYKEELAGLMAAEPPQVSDRTSDPNGMPQVFHPPPLSSSPSPHGSFPTPQGLSSYPLAPSPTQPQLGFSYPHQASQSPGQAHDPIGASPYQMQCNTPQQRVVHNNPFHTHISYYSPTAQESMAQNAMATMNSSVDRSSILPQWQMNPGISVTSSSGGANQPLYYPPARYQQGDISNSCAPPYPNQQGLPGSIASSQAGPPQYNAAGQGRPTLPVAQEQGPHLIQSQSAKEFREHSHQNLSRPSSTPVFPVPGQLHIANSSPIGFEQMVTGEAPLPQQTYSELPAHPPAQPPQQSQPQLMPRPAASLTPSPPPARVTPPPVSPQPQKFGVPEQKWQCSHCTFINDPGTRVCIMCDRTSDNPMLISQSQDPAGEVPMPLEEPSGLYEMVSPQEIAEIPVFGAAEAEVSNVNKDQQLAKIQGRIAEEQDQVYLEKKEAHKQYFQLQPKLGHLNQHTKSSSPPRESPPPLPPAVVAPPPRPALPPRKSTSGQPVSKSTTPVEPIPAQPARVGDQTAVAAGAAAKSAKPESGLKELVSNVGGDTVGGHGGGSGDSFGLGNLDSAMSFVKEGDFSMTMERFSEQKKIKQLQLHGADLMHYVKMADRQNFQVEEMQAALLKCEGDHREALNWLRTEWSKLVQVVISSTRAEGQRSEQNDIGDLSAEEARKALRETKGDMMFAVKSCVAKRKELYSKLNTNGTFAREEVLQTMLQSCGDEEAAREQLYTAVLQPFLDRVWQRQEQGERTSRTLLEMAQAEGTACQSVSTSIISHPDFQQTIMDKNVNKDRRIRMILVEGKLRSWGRADMVIKLLDVDLPNIYPIASLSQGEEAPYSLEDVVEAVRNCRDRQSARAYLAQECSTCFSNYPMSKIRNLNFCQCKICSCCLKQNFEVVIREKHVRHWTCPICGLPDLNDADTASEYLSFLGMVLQTQVEKEVYDLFEMKVRDWYLQKDPNFLWCAHCGNGFIADERQLRMVCPYCNDKTCFSCKRQWEDQHDGLTCEQFAQWKIENDPNNQAVGLARHLEENGIDCPSCKMRYALAKGGCMHFKCPQCGHEFCSGCYKPFYQRGMCPSRLKSCKTSGLHAHHPRDCFFYLRDEDVDRLQSLLRDNNVQFNTTPPDSQEDTSHCPVIEQKEFDSGKCDESCGKDTNEGHAGLCVTHYKEYLVGLINKNKIDPAVIMTLDELKQLVKRAEMSCPKMSSNESEGNYRKRFMKFVKDKIPLPRRSL